MSTTTTSVSPIDFLPTRIALFAHNPYGYRGHLKICQTSNPCVLSSRYAIESQEISDVAAVSGVLEVLEVQPSPSVDHSCPPDGNHPEHGELRLPLKTRRCVDDSQPII
ncbi:hypothetical protein VE04_02029 [Pseudogymnoascus sp. 24MN13]|nr:hypothetical protein VE04_02029 [Pseudogymnoascus sp. 24MN13]